MKKMTLLLLILFSFTSVGFGQVAGDLVITEFMANPAILGDAEGEYLELYNHTNSSIDLQGWTLKDDGTNSLVISGSCVVPANGVATLAISAAPGFTPTYDYSVDGSFTISNAADEIVLLHPVNGEICRINYSDGSPFGSGISAELNDIANHVAGVTLEANYIAATNSYNGDKGSPNTLGGTVPVELTSFTATTVDGGVMLNWTTATEVNNYEFEIQRADISNQISEKDWTTIGFVDGHGNSNSPKEYSYFDNSGATSYRLKQVDTDGGFEYSDVVTVSGSLSKTELLQNHPNPFNPSTQIRYEIKDTRFVSLKVYNLLGENVETLVNKEQNAGNYEVDFNANSFASGFYFYRLETAGYTKTMKMLLIK